MVGKAATVQLAFYSQEAECSERVLERMHARAFHFVPWRILSQGMTLLTMNVPSHINEHSQDNPPQTRPEPRLSSDFSRQAGNEHRPSELPFDIPS